jgi:cystathionine beta-lyase/cystathionine gamma-synthase
MTTLRDILADFSTRNQHDFAHPDPFDHKVIEDMLRDSSGYVAVETPSHLIGNIADHDRIVRRVHRYWLRDGFKSVRPERNYHHRGYIGEFDVKGVTDRGKIHYGEIKSKDSYSCLTKGIRQLKRSMLAYGRDRIIGVLYMPEEAHLFDARGLEAMPLRVKRHDA